MLCCSTAGSGEGTRPNIVAARGESDNLPAARLAAGTNALIIDADDIAVRLIAQAHRQSGLSSVFNELLRTSRGNEFYFHDQPALAGSTYADTLAHYALGMAAGLRRSDGEVLNSTRRWTPSSAPTNQLLVDGARTIC